MNKENAMNILNEVQGYGPSYIKEYGVSTVREALNYVRRLKKNKEELSYLIDNISEKLLRVNSLT